MAGGSIVIECAVTLLLVLSCGADILLNRQRAFETIKTQDITELNEKVSKMQENIEILTQMVNASLQQNGQAPDGSNTATAKYIDRKLSRTTRQLHAAFANQKKAVSNELTRMGEAISSTRGELKEQVDEIQKKVQSVTEEYANLVKSHMDDVLLQIHNHTVNVGSQLQYVASAATQDRTMQLIEEISNQTETTDKCVAGIKIVFQQTTSDLLEGIAKQFKTTNENVANIETVLRKTTSDLLQAIKFPCPVNIRLVGGPSARSGRIEVRHGADWGTVCNDDFDDNNNGATVICRMLGYTRGVPTMSYGEGDGRILLDGVQCMGAEECILDCSRNDFGTHDCNHNEDVGVDCY